LQLKPLEGVPRVETKKPREEIIAKNGFFSTPYSALIIKSSGFLLCPDVIEE
jgi:hypothetical protein